MEIVRQHMGESIGTWLDFGCGNGNFLAEIPNWFPDAELVGAEWDESGRANIEGLLNVRQFVTSLEEVNDRSLDALSMIHVLEHIENPLGILSGGFRVLRPGGSLVVQVPLVWSNPFALMIADHATHFDCQTLASLVTSAGFDVMALTQDAIPGELTLVARRPLASSSRLSTDRSLRTDNDGWHSFNEAAELVHALAETVDWLKRACSRVGETAILGTSIAGTWSAAVVSGEFTSWVDEDPLRLGREWLDRTIHGFDSLSTGALVLVPLAPLKSGAVVSRLASQYPQIRFEAPAPMEAWWSARAGVCRK
jgi:SAM-dependent methyltransferase